MCPALLVTPKVLRFGLAAPPSQALQNVLGSRHRVFLFPQDQPCWSQSLLTTRAALAPQISRDHLLRYSKFPSLEGGGGSLLQEREASPPIT